jgi:CheY-like chemotaxis protein
LQIAQTTCEPPGQAARQIGFEVYVSSPANTPPRILCVDDRVASLEARRALLTTLGYDVLIASDPPSALAITGKVEVNLVILDYSFPGQMTGEELAHKLRAANPKLPLIMLSGVPDLPDSAAASVDVLILKGAGRPTDLMHAIARLLQGKSSA